MYAVWWGGKENAAGARVVFVAGGLRHLAFVQCGLAPWLRTAAGFVFWVKSSSICAASVIHSYKGYCASVSDLVKKPKDKLEAMPLCPLSVWRRNKSSPGKSLCLNMYCKNLELYRGTLKRSTHGKHRQDLTQNVTERTKNLKLNFNSGGKKIHNFSLHPIYKLGTTSQTGLWSTTCGAKQCKATCNCPLCSFLKARILINH